MKIIIQYESGIDIATLVASHGGTILRHWNIPGIKICLAEVPESRADNIERTDGIMGITVSTDDDISITEVPQGILTSSYTGTWSHRHIGIPQVHATGNTGEGIKLAVLDTGIAPHSDLKIAGGFNAIDAGQPWTDFHSHGTHCAGIATAQNDTGEGVTGCAPGAELYAVKVLSNTGGGSWSSVVTAYEWCIQNGIQVTSNSYSGSGDPGVPLRSVLKAANDVGMINVFAAGNNGQNGGDTTGYPAKLDEAIAVSATASVQNDLAGYSSIGPPIEVAAPGSDINSTVLDNGYGIKSGTSMACPHVAGIVCLAIKAGVVSPRAKLATSGTKELGAPGRDPSFGWGLIDAPGMVGEGGDLPVFSRSITVDAGDSSDDGEIVQFTYVWGDGSGTGGSTHPRPIDKTYKADGIYEVTVVLNDDSGAEARDSRMIEVRGTPSENAPPVVRFTITDRG